MADLPAPADLATDAAAAVAFDWHNCWYPLAFVCDVPRDRPTRVTLHDEGLVLFFDGAGQLSCLRDLCPHRAARLSDGQLMDGRLECRYHGWQFDAAGDCQFIPQMLPGKDYPIRSCVRHYPLVVDQDIAWVWAGAPDAADPQLIPRNPALARPDVHAVTFQMDLPYDQTYLIENVIDVAHIHIAHDGVRGGGQRAAAKPLHFTIAETGPGGLRATYRSVGLARGADAAQLREARVAFVAPNLVRYESAYADADLIAGLELHAVPLGKGRARLLYRKYSNFYGWRERIKPRWMEHLTQCLILEQDMAVIVGQHAEIERADRPLRELWLPIKSSDRLVVAYRSWLDRHGADLPHCRGFATTRGSGPGPAGAPVPHGRHDLHTAICSTCRTVVRWIDRGLWAATATAAAAVALAVATAGQGAVPVAALGLAAVAGAAGLALRRFRARF